MTPVTRPALEGIDLSEERETSGGRGSLSSVTARPASTRAATDPGETIGSPDNHSLALEVHREESAMSKEQPAPETEGVTVKLLATV